MSRNGSHTNAAKPHSGSSSQSFAGFRPLQANFTPTPNQFFDDILGHYPSRVVTVVGILIRSTVGWRDDVTGDRRVEVELPLSAFIRPELCEASARRGLAEAIAAGFIVRTAPATAKESARYALRWADGEAQRQAIERERRAQSDPLLEDEERGLKNRPLLFGGLKSSPPYINKRSSEKETSIEDSGKKTFNVSEEPDGYKSLVLEPVLALVAMTGDHHSFLRFKQLREICVDNNATGAWVEALRSTERRMSRADKDPLQKPGAWFDTALVRELDKRGVPVLTGSGEEREEVRGLIGASLGLTSESDAG